MKIELEMENKTKENASIGRMILFFLFGQKVCQPRMIDGLIDG